MAKPIEIATRFLESLRFFTEKARGLFLLMLQVCFADLIERHGTDGHAHFVDDALPNEVNVGAGMTSRPSAISLRINSGSRNSLSATAIISGVMVPDLASRY